MRYDHLTMLPEDAFKHVAGRMTLEGGGGGKGQSAPPPPAAPQLPQASKQPERDPFVQANKQSALTSGPSSTMLTGGGGVAPSGLSLGRSSLYDNEKDKLGA